MCVTNARGILFLSYLSNNAEFYERSFPGRRRDRSSLLFCSSVIVHSKRNAKSSKCVMCMYVQCNIFSGGWVAFRKPLMQTALNTL